MNAGERLAADATARPAVTWLVYADGGREWAAAYVDSRLMRRSPGGECYTATFDGTRRQPVAPAVVARAVAAFPAGTLEPWPELAPLVNGNCNGSHLGADPWERPVPLGRSQSLPSFPVESLPSWLSDYVGALATATQTPPDLAGMLTLSALATVAGGLARVEVRPGWREPLNIFGAVALVPGSRKSAVVAEVTAPLSAFEAEEVERLRATIVEADTARKIAEGAAVQAQAAAAKAGAENAAGLRDDAVRLAQEAAAIVVPPTPRLLADDATPEALTTLLAQHGRIALLAPEGDVFDMMAGRYQSGGGPNLGVYLKGHAGDAMRVDRKGRPPEYVAAPALTVGLAVQPDVLRSIADRPGFRGRGLLARFLYSVPVNTVGSRKVAAPPVPAAVRTRYDVEVRALARSLVDQAEATSAAGSVPSVLLVLSREAAAVVEAFEAEIEPRLDPEAGDLGHVADWAAKLAGAAVRIAGLLHLAEHLRDGWAAPVSGATAEAAVTVARYLAEHAVAVFELMGAKPEVGRAHVVLRWIARSGVSSFTKRECYRAMPKGQFEKVDDLDSALDLLEDHGYVRRRPTDSPGPKGGRPPSPTYDVNPEAST